MKTFGFSLLLMAIVPLVGCENKRDVRVDAPGVKVDVGPDGAHVDTPRAKVDAGRDGATVDTPRSDVKVDADAK
jgi:hypothetical protein